MAPLKSVDGQRFEGGRFLFFEAIAGSRKHLREPWLQYERIGRKNPFLRFPPANILGGLFDSRAKSNGER